MTRSVAGPRPARSSAIGAVACALTWLACMGMGVELAVANDRAPARASGEVLVILAHGDEGPIDPSLSSVRALKQPPFNAYRSMKILSRSALELVVDEAFQLNLPNGRWLLINLLERRPDGRAKVQVSINRPNQKDYLPLLEVLARPGEPFFVAGQKYQGGTLVIGVRVGERPTHK